MALSRGFGLAVAATAVMSALVGSANTAHADTVNLSFNALGGGIFQADIAGTGLTSVNNIKVTDVANTAGAAGIFSGFDIDALILDTDGDLATTTDQFFASSFTFMGGSADVTTNSAEQPNTDHPGYLFGAINASTIDFATATLNTFDGVSVADVAVANGFLSLGRGGMLTALFDPEVPVLGSLFLMTGEVGNNGEGLSASVTVSDEPPAVIPLPATLPMLVAAIGGIALIRRRRNS